MFEYDAELGWKGVNNLHTPYYSKDFKITVSHDGNGNRSLFPTHQKNTSNLLLLGDSYGWGWGVENNETAAYLLSKNNPYFNMYNLSIAGYGTDQELLALQKFIRNNTNPAEKPEGVFLLFYFNDFDDISTGERYGYQKPFFMLKDNVLTLSNSPVPKKYVEQFIPATEETYQDDWKLNSQLFNYFIKYGLGRVYQYFFDNHSDEPTITTAAPPGSKELAARLLQEIQSICNNHNMYFHVVFLMTMDTQNYNSNDIYSLAANIKKSGIDHSFFYSRKFPSTDLWLDAHYSPYGQKLLAKHLENIALQKR
jgi:hypothetical protein